MQTWAQLYEIASMKSIKTREALIRAIKTEWEFQKDRQTYEAKRSLELEKLNNGVNKVIKENLDKIPQIEK